MTDHQSSIAWTIAGSDSGGGAGIQADLKVFNAFDVHGCSVVTALTAQNTLGVQSIEPVSETMLRGQLTALAEDLPPDVIKIGMLGSARTCGIVAEFLTSVDVPVVCDPVLKSTSGANLLDPAATDLLIRDIFPHVTVLTPNLPETEQLIGRPIEDEGAAADALLALGAKSVLIKGGHAEGDLCGDFWSNGSEHLWVTSSRVDTRHTHGTGCILSAAIAAHLARGKTVKEAVQAAKDYMTQCLHTPAQVGSGHGPMRIRNPESTL